MRTGEILDSITEKEKEQIMKMLSSGLSVGARDLTGTLVAVKLAMASTGLQRFVRKVNCSFYFFV